MIDLTLIPDEDLTREYMRRLNERRVKAGPPKVITPCKHCGRKFSAREMREHNKGCKARKK